ncbi:gamma tubulin complex Spc98/GCP3 subunit Alp6 [Schizosaccharomyces cryophilus OY26]|uniref:Gamma tubulin complex Spc98/GCP3 subunit Alp6 n=1 Tax=Schizosaccharomyces cryophilus (strain OY26 / ATCC MYA-4695 / CBS 11777 / NBRC 106824 / NRRL Y48691) TaxID=653667 RepID=S9VWA5_SCHCR|nr:gamma tubulin complex Spc98/GCP3 subunit Alp6 [Schizosaccharomyces cryophilus OY26]EPY50524.1 gamma tubulin complex Spc98/GCP3 subunit Alp6 [Schizosaccharomyces cryophilus OY26]
MSELHIRAALSRLADKYLQNSESPSEPYTVETIIGFFEGIINSIPSDSPVYGIEEILYRIFSKRKTLCNRDIINVSLVSNDNADGILFSRLSNLVSRLRTQEVLQNKASILQVLYSLSRLSEGVDELSSSHPTNALSDLQALPPLGPEHTLSESTDGRNTDKNRSISERNSIYEWTSLSQKQPTPTQEKASYFEESNDTEDYLKSAALFILQGISTDLVKFHDGNADLSQQIPSHHILQIRSLCEIGLLYQELKKFADYDGFHSSHSTLKMSDSSYDEQTLALQSFRAFISKELTQYLSLIASLESQLRTDNSTSSQTVSIRRCIVWTNNSRLKFRILSSIVNSFLKEKNKKKLIHIVAQYSFHGDPIIHDLSKRVLMEITQPLHEMIANWVYKGELVDPFREFFVNETDDISHTHDRQGTGRIVWKGKYHLEKELIPSFLSSPLVEKIFLIGKCLNFARYGCDDSEWTQDHYRKFAKKLSYTDSQSLKLTIDMAYTQSTRHLVKLMEEKFHLSEHLNAIKKYILLGQGDFVAYLMESLGDSLEQPANTLFRHNLTACLESAIRSSNASYEPEYILKRLDARLLELSHGEVGWDVFTLEYKVDSPINVIITPYCSRQYLKMFNFLWRLKRIEFVLSHSWRRSTLGVRNIIRELEFVQPEWHFVSIHLAEMIHFICQLQYYILFEVSVELQARLLIFIQVIEISWEKLKEAMLKPNATLDTYIEAHHHYVTSITHKGLLGSARSRTEDSFLHQLHELLKIILSFHNSIEALYNFSISLYSRLKINAPISTESLEEQYVPIQEKLQHCSEEFQLRLKHFLYGLATQKDSEMRFLSVRLNFNEFYAFQQKKV